MFEGFRKANEGCVLGQDNRALCPEIRTSLLLGPAFLDFVHDLVLGKEAIEDPTIPYLLPSPWWDDASNGVPESEVEEFEEYLLTLLRNLYICMLSYHPS